MGKFIYTPDNDLKVHEEGAIRLICKAFMSHESGLPEWLKNSADAYAREDAPEKQRVIVLIFDYGRTRTGPSISCLDFCGMTRTSIEQNFRIWADPEAALRGAKKVSVQGGHGNGGKCYMTQMFEDYALIHTVKKAKGSRYGIGGGSIRFGYIPDRQNGREFPVADLRSELDRVLKLVRCSVGVLPEAAQDALHIADGFSLVMGARPKGYGTRIAVHALIGNLQDQPQMTRTLEMCKVYVMINGAPFNQGKPLTLQEIPPMPGAEQPKVVVIPALLKDPVSSEEVSTVNSGSLPAGSLSLRTSNVSMRWSRKIRHSIVFKAQSGYIGYVPVSELDVQSSYRDRLYGECHLESLEAFRQNERARLANSPLTRAVEHFISEQVQAYAKEFEAKDRRLYDQEEKNTISKMNEALDRWKNRFLGEMMRGVWDIGKDGPKKEPQPSLPAGKPARLELTLTHGKSGLGVAFRPTLKFFDPDGRRIRPVPFRWVSDDNNIAMVDEDLMIINTFSYGRTNIHAETLDGKLQSNMVPLDVVRIHSISVSPSHLNVAAGSRAKLDAVCTLSNGEQTSSVFLVWTEANPKVASVSSSGLVFGFEPGETKVVAGDDGCLAQNPSVVVVSAGSGRGIGNRPGKGYPRVLISDVNPDPDTGETVTFSVEDPPVQQRPQDVPRNVWWINGSAPLAKMYLDANRDYGSQSREWRMYLLERHIDVMVQIALVNGPVAAESLSVEDWIYRWGERVAEIQPAVASALAEFIATGKIPEE